jgi:hypothetical protein
MYSLEHRAYLNRKPWKMRNASRSATVAACSHVHVVAAGSSGGVAVYTLADPRDVQSPRYVGQTRDPHARFTQHVQTARLWLPDDEGRDARGRATQGAVAEVPWWVRSPKHRPLYAWIRELHCDGGRLPFMWVEEWVEPDTDPLVAERASIMRWLARGAALLNVEALKLGAQLPLL